ncbi:MAG: GNAT family N-acetyltransferase [Bacteroidota bacterium]
MISIETNRLRVRTLLSTDWQDFFEYRSDPGVCQFQGYEPYTIERCKDFCETQSHTIFGEAGKWVQLGIELVSEKKLIGDIGLKPESFDTRIVEFGITLSHQFQGSGYATEALTAVMDYLYTNKQVHRIVGITDQENKGSIEMFQRVGFRKEGATKQSFWNDNMWRDEYIFAMLKEEFHR